MKYSTFDLQEAIKWLHRDSPKSTIIVIPFEQAVLPDWFFDVPKRIEEDFEDAIDDAIIDYMDEGYEYDNLRAAADLRGVQRGYISTGHPMCLCAAGTLREIHRELREKLLAELRKEVEQMAMDIVASNIKQVHGIES